MIKTHLYDSSDPAKEGSDLIAICGQLVKDAAFVKQSEDGFTWTVYDAVMNLGALCSRCRKKMGAMTGKYIYGLQSGQENILQSESHAL